MSCFQARNRMTAVVPSVVNTQQAGVLRTQNTLKPLPHSLSLGGNCRESTGGERKYYSLDTACGDEKLIRANKFDEKPKVIVSTTCRVPQELKSRAWTIRAEKNNETFYGVLSGHALWTFVLRTQCAKRAPSICLDLAFRG